jgi:aspartyl protease family protein
MVASDHRVEDDMLAPGDRVGHVTVRVTIANPTNEELKSEVEALVDTGASFTVVPRALANDLKLPITGRGRVRTAAGDLTIDRGRAFVQIDGQSEINPVYISDTADKVLIGVVTLETLALTVNPKTGELKEAELLWY